MTSERTPAGNIPQGLLDLYDDYAHGRISRRDYLQRLGAYAVGGVTVEALLQQLSPNYSWAQQVAADDPRIETEVITYASPKGGKQIKGLLARPAKAEGLLPTVLVIHENRGLNPYIEDVVRRLAVAGFIALGPDALSPLGGYPGNDDEGRAMQAKRNPEEMIQDFMAAAVLLKNHPRGNGKVGVVGFCFGGGMTNTLAVRLPEIVDAAVPFYGSQPATGDIPKIKAPLLIHYAEFDTRINAGWPAYEEGLKANHIPYTAYVYPQANHGFHNDTTPRYDKAAADLAWDRTLAFFRQHLTSP
jgi:carboxymethylenebutenolidase